MRQPSGKTIREISDPTVRENWTTLRAFALARLSNIRERVGRTKAILRIMRPLAQSGRPELTDANSHTNNFSYNAFGRATQATIPAVLN